MGFRRVLSPASLLFLVVLFTSTAVDAGERCDYDGDGKVDLVAVRATPPSLTWFIRQSTAGFRAFTFGASPGPAGFDMPICGDFDGDGKSDATVLRIVISPTPQPVTWFILESTTGTLRAEQFGSPFDTAYVADWNGDGRDELVMARTTLLSGPASQITHYSKNVANGTFSAFVFGTGDHYILGKADVDGDNISDPIVYDPNTVPGVRYASPSSAGFLLADLWGDPTTDPYRYHGNFDFDSLADFAVMRGDSSSCCEHWIRSQATGTAIPGHGSGFRFGTVSDLPASGDYLGDGRDDIAVYRDSTHILWIHNAADNSVSGIYWGAFGDILMFVR